MVYTKRRRRVACGLAVVVVASLSLILNGCAIAALTAAIAYASSSADEADAMMLQARADWERMNVERVQAGLEPLPWHGDEQLEEMSPEDMVRGREAWERLNARREAQGKKPIPMPDEYLTPEEKAEKAKARPKHTHEAGK